MFSQVSVLGGLSIPYVGGCVRRGVSIPEGVGMIISRGYTYSPLYMGLEIPTLYYWNLVIATITRMVGKWVVRILLECFLLCWLLSFVTQYPVADLRGREGCAPHRGGPNFMQFLEKFGKTVCWRPPSEDWRPHLREILSPPLNNDVYYLSWSVPSLIAKYFQRKTSRDL